MSRYPIARKTPAEPTFEGDQGFLGLNMKTERDKLQPGYCARSINKRFANGVASKRPGSIMPFFANAITYASILGAAVYSDPRGPEQLLIATPTEVWRMASGGSAAAIALPTGVTLSGNVHFVQAFDKVLLFRGPELTPLQWDGTATGDFVVVEKKNPADTSTILIPGADRAVSTMNRLLVPIERTNVAVSDIGDYTSYDPIFANFPINLGTSDVIIRIFPYVRGGIIVGKENRTELVSGWTDPAHPENARLEVLSTEVGTCAWDSWAMVGGDVFFLSKPGGVYRIGEVVQERLEASAVPVSDAIEPLIKRINWPYAGAAVAAVHGFYYYLAVPLDGSRVNNALLVYNTVTKQWEGYDEWAAAAEMQIDSLFVFNYHGSRRLYAINKAAKSVHLLGEGKFDETKAGRFEIADLFETRGYSTEGWNGASSRDSKRLEVQLGAWWPSIRLYAMTERANDLRPLHSQPITRARRKWQVWGRTDYALNNVDGNHGAAGRQDYSVDFTQLDGAGLYLENGIDFERKQQFPERISPHLRSRYVSLRIESTQGDCDICAVSTESSGVQRHTRRAA